MKKRGTLLDVDGTYRVLIPAIIRFLNRLSLRLRISGAQNMLPVAQTVPTSLAQIGSHLEQTSCDKGVMRHSGPTGWMAMGVVTLLSVYLLTY